MTEEELRMHIKHLENIKIRYERGDGLYGRATVGTLLTEIEILSERCLKATGEQP